MTRRYTLLAGTAAAVTYLLIVLGAVVRITGSGMGCGDHWPLCNGRLFPPLDDIGTLIEWSHRLVAAIVSILVAGLAVYAWTVRRAGGPAGRPPVEPAYVALALLIIQVLLGAITVWLELPAWSVILHLGTAMLLLATLLIAATGGRLTPDRGSATILALTFVTVLFGALTANLGAAAACGGFPLCNGQLIPSAGGLAHIHWAHRLLAYALAVVVTVWALRRPSPATRALLALVVAQVALGAATVLMGLPPGLQAAHLAVGTAVWGGAVLSIRP
jgi:heme A synthase